MKKIGKFIKSNTKLLAGIILGATVSGGAVYAATTIASSQVGYDNSTSGLAATDVQGALDELYTKANHCKLDFRQEFLQNVDNPDDFSQMFIGSTKIPCLDLSNWDTSHVTNMAYMFSGASSLTSLDLSNFYTSRVTNMGGMFYGASSLTSLDLSNFDTSRVENMSSMFRGASSLTSLNLRYFDTSEVRYMNSMFRDASSLTSLDISSFDTSRVTVMDNMFSGANPNLQVTINCENLNLIDQINGDLGSGHYTCAN